MVQQQLINYVGKSLLLLGLVHCCMHACAVFSVQFLEINTVTRATIACPQQELLRTYCQSLNCACRPPVEQLRNEQHFKNTQLGPFLAQAACNQSYYFHCVRACMSNLLEVPEWAYSGFLSTVGSIRISLLHNYYHIGSTICNMQEACSWKAKTWH